MTIVMSASYQYQVGGSLPLDAPSYVVRKADRDLYQSLKAGQFCYVLNSRQMGKSSLRVQTIKKLEADGVVCAAIDLTSIGSQNITPEQWYGGILYSLVSSFDELDEFDLGSWWCDRSFISPPQRFNEFIREVLLKSIAKNIVVFIDEIDCTLSLNFKVDDFFALIRSCYNKRAESPEYNRLSFAILGVARPSELMQDKNRTPFNIGTAIELTGFQLEECLALVKGLEEKVSHPQAVMKEILVWTGGSPFLTQKLCKIVGENAENFSIPNLAEWLEKLVQTYIIENWEARDEPEHLKTIRDRILLSSSSWKKLLTLYDKILRHQEIPANDSSEQMELRLSGLTVKQAIGKKHSQPVLKVCNRIYESIFNASWVNKQLGRHQRPYHRALVAWLISGSHDESKLLKGKELKEALAWAKNKKLTRQDYQFLFASSRAVAQTQYSLQAAKNLSSRMGEAKLLLPPKKKQEKEQEIEIKNPTKTALLNRKNVVESSIVKIGSDAEVKSVSSQKPGLPDNYSYDADRGIEIKNPTKTALSNKENVVESSIVKIASDAEVKNVSSQKPVLPRSYSYVADRSRVTDKHAGDEQILYNRFIECVQNESPEQIIDRFRQLFIDGMGNSDAEIEAALYKIICSVDGDRDFILILNRCCYIVINRWQASSRRREAIAEFVNLFTLPPRFQSIISRSHVVRRLQKFVNNFINSEEYLRLKRLVKVVKEPSPEDSKHTPQVLSELIYRYPYLYDNYLLSGSSSSEYQRTIRSLRVQRQEQFEIDLCQYCSYLVEPTQILANGSESGMQIMPPLPNPTLLSDRELLLAIEEFVGKVEGNYSYKDLANLFLNTASNTQSYADFKADLYEYLIGSIAPEYGQKKFYERLSQILKKIYTQSDSLKLNDFLLGQTCKQLFKFLVVESQKNPNHYVFLDMISNIGTSRTIGLLLKITLLSHQVKTDLEKKFSILFNHYEGKKVDEMKWLVKSLENVNIALVVNLGNVDISSIKDRLN